MKTGNNGNRQNLYGRSGYKKFLVTLFGIILVVLLVSVPVFGRIGPPYRDVSLPELKNYQFVEPRDAYPTIVIDKKGKAWLYYDEVKDTPNSIMIIEDYLLERNCKKSKAFLRIDENVQFGRITEVLRILSKAGIKVVSFITQEFAAPIDFYRDFDKNQVMKKSIKNLAGK